ncbi:diguanylate cyclase [Aliiglaciecola sp. CAU 1673]|uniref:GGDEF domain-containing protein n=1 Tax=Aliiglaciecola sp. CAU 1673 TaxID=3032595 RepID=UPI0023DC5D24|nr:sensor domain-containing diguanylate cyclase [Aliiglaciecola sp. CAU 1673]MDF2178036.1 diguanylate cyclase [Aliiglaciecola sp. CAU 1673]
MKALVRYCLQFLTLASSYALFGFWGIELATFSYNISLIWPPVGIAVALLLRWDLRLWPAILVGGTFLDTVFTGHNFWMALQIAATATIPIYLCCYTLKRLGFDARLESNSDILLFTLIGVLACSMLMALLGVSLLTWHQLVSLSDFAKAWLNWTLGDITGVLIFGIPLLSFNLNRLNQLFRPAVMSVFFLMLLLCLEIFVLQSTSMAPAMALLPMLGLLWIALRTNLAVTSWVILALAMVAGYGALNQQGIFANLSNPILGTWLYVTSLGVASLILAASAMESRLKTEQMRYAIKAARLGIWDWRLDEGKLYFNNMWTRLLGYSASYQVLTLEAFEKLLHPDDLQSAREAVRSYLKGQQHQLLHVFRLKHADGSWRIIRSDGQIVERDRMGKVLRMCGTHADITEQQTTQQELEDTTRFLQRISEQVPGAIFQFRIDQNGQMSFPYANQGMEKLTGLSNEVLKESANPVMATIDERYRESFKQDMESSRQNLSILHSEFRVTMPSPGWREVFARPEHQADGSTLWHGYVTDISQHKALEQDLRELNQTLVRAQQAARLGTWTADLQSGQMWWSDVLFDIFAVDNQAHTNLSMLLELVHPEDKEKVEQAWQQAKRSGHLNVEHRIVRSSGAIRWIHQLANRTEEGKLEGTAQDITARKSLEVRFHEQAMTDELTGIANRRAFMQLLEQEWSRFRRHQLRPAFVILMDIDFFKKVNDTHGHDIGDKVLCHFTSLISNRIRKDDRFGRLGGEEFAVLVTDSNLEDVLILAETLRENIENRPLSITRTTKVAITASFGVACFSNNDQSFDEVLISADRALYRAKSSGRNKVMVDEPHAQPINN